MTTITNTPLLKDITSDWIREFSVSRKEPAWLLALRTQALAQFNSLPWPSKRDERWRRSELELLSWDTLHFSPTNTAAIKSTGAEWMPLEEALTKKETLVQAQWTLAVERAKANKFESLNLALGNGGLCLFIPKNQQLKAPLHQSMSSLISGTAQFVIHFLFVDEGAEAQIWEELNGGDENGISFLSTFTCVNLAANAKVGATHLQQWNQKVIHFQFQDITQEADSKLNTIAIALGGRVFRNETTIRLHGKGAENKVLGVLFGDENQNFENWITQNHTGPKTTSDIRYRGALKGSAHSFFSGLVSITKSAQQSDAFQSAKSLLLSREARADAIPNLEILADDVKCSHGAAVGPVDEDQKYYLATRGIKPTDAEKLIIQGFFEPVIAEVPSVPVQEQLRAFVEQKLSSDRS